MELFTRLFSSLLVFVLLTFIFFSAREDLSRRQSE